VTNGDIYHTVDVAKLYDEHNRTQARVTLAVHDYPRFNTINVTNSKIQGFGADRPHISDSEKLAFTGIHILEPDVLEPIASKKKSCIIDRYKEMVIGDYDSISLVRVDGNFWTDIGTPDDYLQLHGDLLTKAVPVRNENRFLKNESPFMVGSKASSGFNLELIDWACIGNAKIGDNVTIARSVVWNDVVIPDNSVIVDAIVAK